MLTTMQVPRGPLWPGAVLLALGVTLVVNALATTLPLAGRSTGEISDLYFTRFTPAGFTFAIWGVIYAGLLAYAVYQATPAGRRNARVQSVAPLFVITSALNTAWLLAWHNLLISLSVVLMLALLGTLIVIYGRLRSGPPSDRAELWLVRVPFSLYLGWITVATVANASSLLVALGVTLPVLSAGVWAAVLVGVAAALGVIFSVRFHDLAYGAVIAWAFLGIYGGQQGTPVVTSAALVGVAVVVAAALIGQWRARQVTPVT